MHAKSFAFACICVMLNVSFLLAVREAFAQETAKKVERKVTSACVTAIIHIDETYLSGTCIFE